MSPTGAAAEFRKLSEASSGRFAVEGSEVRLATARSESESESESVGEESVRVGTMRGRESEVMRESGIESRGGVQRIS
jgi:hypothetical protein